MEYNTEIIKGDDGEYTVKYIHNKKTIEFLATRNEDGTFDIPLYAGYFKSVPYVGTFESYKKMDYAYQFLIDVYPNGYVCRVEYNSKNAYVFFLPKEVGGDAYIRL